MPHSAGPFILFPEHAAMLDRFLMPRAESSLMLLANARSQGLEDKGDLFQGTYAAYRHGDEITGVAAHYRNGMVVLQAPEDASGLLDAVLAASGRECTGIAGPYDQVQQALAEILKKNRRPAMNGRETLFSLSLDTLGTPALLQAKEATCRHPGDDELSAMIDLRIAFMREHLGPDLRSSHEKEARDLVTSQYRKNHLWILEASGAIVATAAFSAAIPELVQPGGVYTLPAFRSRGYGKAVVAGSLLEARARGARKAVLFTGTDMPAAQRMYRALGFRPVGEYGLVMFQEHNYRA